MKNFILPFLYSFAVVLLFSCGRVSEPNPILGKWQPDTNLKTIVVFSDSLRLHSCNGVTSYGYKLENFGKELTVNDRVVFLYYFDDKIRVSEAGKKTVFLQKIK
jgi:hypothetical protein